MTEPIESTSPPLPEETEPRPDRDVAEAPREPAPAPGSTVHEDPTPPDVATETPAADAAADAAADESPPQEAAHPAAPASAPGPGKPGGHRQRPLPRPGPPGRGRTGGPREPKPVPRPPRAGVAPPAPVHDAREAAEAARWGRVDADGTVWVREAESERSVGQYPGADAKEALAYYVVRFLDLQAQVALLEARLAQLSVKEIDQTLASLDEALKEPAAVGDLTALRERLARVSEAADERRAEAAAEREAAKREALAARTTIVERAEQLAQTDPARMQWRQAGDELRTLLDEWKEAQRHGPRLDKAREDQLWKRFSHARTTFDRGRRQFFADQELRRSEARSAKEELISTAETLATSTDWAATTNTFRDLMTRWKAAGRTGAREDDALWERFKGAQDAFFAARNAAGAATEAEYAENLKAKEGLLEEAEALVPVKDVNRARSALRDIQDRWEAAGKVPRSDMQRVEGRLRAVEQAVRDAQQQVWTRRNPEMKARAEGALAQLEASIAGLEADLSAAQAAGDARAVKAAKEALSARQAWLAQVRRTAEEVR